MDGTALVLCEGAFGTPAGKTAHGLIRFTERYQILGILDSHQAGKDSGEVLDGKPNGIPIFASLPEAVETLGTTPKYLVVGQSSPTGGLLPGGRNIIRQAINLGMNIDSGLRQFLTEDADLPGLAQLRGVSIRDVRKPKDPRQLHLYSGKISQVDCVKIAVLGTDSLVGKRTTAINLRQGLRHVGLKTFLVGTGQTSWLQGMKYCVITDTMMSHYLTGEIEDTVYQAYVNEQPDVILLEGQGSLTDPLRPGGLELLCAARPDAIIVQHAPKRKFHTQALNQALIPLKDEIKVIELLTQKPVIAITLNHEGMTDDEIQSLIEEYEIEYRVPTLDVLKEGPARLVSTVLHRFPELVETIHKKRGEAQADESSPINRGASPFITGKFPAMGTAE